MNFNENALSHWKEYDIIFIGIHNFMRLLQKNVTASGVIVSQPKGETDLLLFASLRLRKPSNSLLLQSNEKIVSVISRDAFLAKIYIQEDIYTGD